MQRPFRFARRQKENASGRPRFRRACAGCRDVWGLRFRRESRSVGRSGFGPSSGNTVRQRTGARRDSARQAEIEKTPQTPTRAKGVCARFRIERAVRETGCPAISERFTLRATAHQSERATDRSDASSRTRAGSACVCRPRSRHEQLPAACSHTRPSRSVPGHRRLFAHRAAWRRTSGKRAARRCRHGPGDRSPQGLRRQASPTLRAPLPFDRDGGLPFGGERRGVSVSRQGGNGTVARGHRPPHRGAAGGFRLRFACRTGY